MLQENTCQQETVIFFAAGDLSRTEELALLVPQVTVPPKSDRCERVGWPLTGPRVQNGHFPSGKVGAIYSHPTPALSAACAV